MVQGLATLKRFCHPLYRGRHWSTISASLGKGREEERKRGRIRVGGRRGSLLQLSLRWAEGKEMLDGAHVNTTTQLDDSSNKEVRCTNNVMTS